MTVTQVLVATLSLLSTVLPWSPGRDAAPACIIATLRPPLVQWEDRTRLIGSIVENEIPDRTWEMTDVELRRWGGAGHVVRVEEVSGQDAGQVNTGGLVHVFRWRLDSSCFWSGLRDSLSLGSRHHFTMVLRPDSLWVGGRPTFDVPPGLPGTYPGGREHLGPTFPLEVYLEFLATLPSGKEWTADCRPGVLRTRSWLEAHPDASRYSTFTQARDLLSACDGELEGRAESLERWDYSGPLPEALLQWLRERSCADEDDVRVYGYFVEPGRFTESPATQWALICQGSASWRLLIVVLEESPRVIELARMAGDGSYWSVGAAGPQYFDWTFSREFRSSRGSSMTLPTRDIVLLQHFHEPETTLAFYETDRGWHQVIVDCCRWPDGMF